MNDSYYLYSSGSLKQKDKTIEFTSADGEKRSLPIENVRDIYIMSEMQMTTKLLELFGKYGIMANPSILLPFFRLKSIL